MSSSALLLFAVALIVTAGSPGPSVAALVARVLTNGFREVLPFLAAMWLGEAIWLTLAVTGLATVAQSFATAFLVVKFAGVAYLVFLAGQMWFAPAVAPDGSLPRGQRPWRMFLAGLTVTMGNPKIMVFYMALLPSIIDLGGVGPLAWGELIATMLGVLVCVDLSWSLMASRARRLMANSRAVRWVNRAGAAVMASAAAAIAAR